MSTGIAPVDARQQNPWPFWRKVLAYLFMMALASASIWLIDRLAMRQMQQLEHQETAGPQN